MIASGSILYFIVFNKDYSGVFETGNIIINVNYPILFALICIVISTVMIPIQLLELGERSARESVPLEINVQVFLYLFKQSSGLFENGAKTY